MINCIGYYPLFQKIRGLFFKSVLIAIPRYDIIKTVVTGG